MKNFLIVVLFLSLVSCDPMYKRKLKKEITHQENIVLDENLEMNDSVAMVLMKNYKEFAREYPTDEESPNCLFKAAELANGIGSPSAAIDLYRQVYEAYPEYKEAPMCLFILGFIYENQLQNYKMAGMYYRDFLKKFPDHELSEDVKLSIKNLGKTPDELIKEFEQKLENGEIDS
jgi:TolA-binding protein